MSLGVVVGTAAGRHGWVTDCSRSLGNVEHVIVSTVGYEASTITWAMEHTTFDRFVFLKDSVVVTDVGVFDRIADTPGSLCLCHDAYHGEHMSCYLGVYERSVLESMLPLPVVKTKWASVHLGEHGWTQQYVRAASVFTCFDNPPKPWLPDEYRHGRMNAPQDTGFLVKYRGYYTSKDYSDEAEFIRYRESDFA